MKIGHAPPSRSVSETSPARPPRGKERRSFLEVLGEKSGPRGPAISPPRAIKLAAKPTVPEPSAPSPLVRGVARALQGAAAGEARLDSILDAAARGKTFTPAELLSMQATVFRYSQTVEVLSRATDRIVGAVKQTLGTQV